MIVNSIPHFRSGANNKPIKPTNVPLPSSDELLKDAQRRLKKTPPGTPYEQMSREAQIASKISFPTIRKFLGWVAGTAFLGSGLTNQLPMEHYVPGAIGSVVIARHAEEEEKKLLKELAAIAAKKAKQLGAMK